MHQCCLCQAGERAPPGRTARADALRDAGGHHVLAHLNLQLGLHHIHHGHLLKVRGNTFGAAAATMFEATAAFASSSSVATTTIFLEAATTTIAATTIILVL